MLAIYGILLAETRRFPLADRRLRDHRLDRQLRAARALLPALPAIAPGNLAISPLSDRFGRRPVVFASLGLFVVASLAGIVAPSLELLVVAQVLQAFGGGAAMAVMRATILDHFGPAHVASALAANAIAILVAPMLAPTLGGLAIEWLDWRAVCALPGLLAAAVMRFAAHNLRETRPADPSAGPSLRFWANYRRLLGSCVVSIIYTFVRDRNFKRPVPLRDRRADA